jgi:transposase
VRIVFHRELEGAPKTATVVRYPPGKWYVVIACEVADTPADEEAPLTGFDLGLTSYVTASDGETVGPAPRLVKSTKKLRREQRRLAQKTKGSQRRERLAYKAERAGKPVVLVPPHGTSQVCSDCNALVPKVLSEREHRCEACGLVMDRDHNAAINVKRRGERVRKLEKATAGSAGSSGGGMLPVNARGEETPTAEGQLLRQVLSGKREAPSCGTG